MYIYIQIVIHVNANKWMGTPTVKYMQFFLIILVSIKYICCYTQFIGCIIIIYIYIYIYIYI